MLSVDNFRDIAGPNGGYRVGTSTLKEGVIYRSNAVSPDAADLATLTGLGLTTVYDLRTTAEIAAKPDRLPNGVRAVRHNIAGDTSPAATYLTSLRTPDQARQLLIQGNVGFVENAAERDQIAAVIRDLATTTGPQLVHCTSGKDRTGWVTAVIQSLVGVDRADVMSDYLLTNRYSAESITTAAQQATAKGGPEFGDAVRVVSGVFPEALQAGFDTVDKMYGSIQNYGSAGLGLDESTISALRQKLLS